jgi:hypothetical protein
MGYGNITIVSFSGTYTTGSLNEPQTESVPFAMLPAGCSLADTQRYYFERAEHS